MLFLVRELNPTPNPLPFAKGEGSLVTSANGGWGDPSPNLSPARGEGLHPLGHSELRRGADCCLRLAGLNPTLPFAKGEGS